MAETIPPTDAELDTLIRARLAQIGIDLGQLPVSDASLRGFLRGTVPTVSNYLLDPQENPPVLYPAQLTAWNV
jgi:hypothetical protein